jgi:hypothetical protein
MIVGLLMLAVPVVIALAFAMSGNLYVLGILASILAVSTLAGAIFTSSSALARVAMLLRPLLTFALVAPAIWMAVQVVPIPVRGLGNPIWATASAALHESLADRLTVDIHGTIQALAQYSAVVAAAFVTAVVALDRQRAPQVLYFLVSITTLVSALSIWRQISGLDNSLPRENGSTPAVLGILLSAAIAIRMIDRLRQGTKPRRFVLGSKTILSLALLSLFVCLMAILIRGNLTVMGAAFFGAGTLFAVFAIRNWFHGLWGTAGVLATAAILATATVSILPVKKDADPTVALSTQNQAATERMLLDVRPAGSGAGAYKMLLPIHRDIGLDAQRERPTAAAAVAIEMGRAFLYGLLIAATLAAGTLFRRSLLRTRDYVYAAVGAGAATALPILAFAEDGILDLAASLLAAALLGLAFGQSQSSTVGESATSTSQELPNHRNGEGSTGRAARSTVFDSMRVRLALTGLSLALITQSIWLLSHRGHLGEGFLTAAATANDAGREKIDETSIATGRGDRWTQGKLAYHEAGKNAVAIQHNEPLASASQGFAAPLRYSPLRGDLWLLLAAASKEYQSPTYDVAALLKLSYYTAPNDLDLLPLRLSVALGTNSAISEPELRELIKRDVKIAVTNRPALEPAIVAAYQAASVDGKTFVDSVMSELDPSYLQNVRVRRP